MLSRVPLTYLLIAVAVICCTSGWSFRGVFEDAKDNVSQKAATLMIKEFRSKESQVASLVEKRLQELRANENTIERHIKTIVERPIYSTSCIDADGLRLINDILDGTAAKPFAEVPGEFGTSPDEFGWGSLGDGQ